jgi:hypothetical protein
LAEGVVILLWFALPLLLISMGTSKLYHYAYPFLPPLALAAGYLVAFGASLANRALLVIEPSVADRLPPLPDVLSRPTVRAALLLCMVVAAGLACIVVFFGPVRLTIGDTVVFKNSGLLRPILIAVACGVLGRAIRSGGGLAGVVLAAAFVLPWPAYAREMGRLRAFDAPLRDASACIAAVNARSSGTARGVYVDIPDDGFTHPLYYYLRRVPPWINPDERLPETFSEYLTNPAEWRPILTDESTYQAFARQTNMSPAGGRPALPSMVALGDLVLLLPGPYGICGADGSLGRPR